MSSKTKPISGIIAGLFILINLCLTPPLQATVMADLNDVSPLDPRLGMFVDLVNHQAFTLDSLGNFRPSEPINKAAFLKATMSYLGFQPIKTLNTFTGYQDVPEESWFAPYVKKALDMRAITNNLNDYFYPAGHLSRQEGLLLIMRIYGLPIPLSAPLAEDLYEDIRTTHPLASVFAAARKYGLYFEKEQEYFRPNLILNRGDAADLLFKAKIAAQIIQGTETPNITVLTPNLDNYLTGTETELLENDKFGILMDAWSKINTQYLYGEQISQDQLVYGAITGMVDSLEDPYSIFNTPDSDGDSYIYIPEDYEGIGAVIEQVNGEFTILTTINNSPAYRAGLKTKDVILEIDGKTLTKLTYEQVTGLIKGAAGTIVKLKIRRDTTILYFEIVREKITIEAIQRKVVGNNINYFRIDQFTESSDKEFNQNLEAIAESGSQKLIIDLRNNPGGYLTSTQAILGHFLGSGKVEFITVDRDQNQSQYLSNGEGELQNYRTVVLVNEGSASASEIFAGALQDYNIARIIGTTTYGKGSVQEITSYADNSTLKLTIAKWLTPELRDINHIGIVPDQTVQITDLQRQAGQDPQLDAAIAFLN